MADATLEKRVTVLEQKVAELAQQATSPPVVNDWRRSVGMFADDDLMKEIDDEGRKIREADRERGRRDRA